MSTQIATLESALSTAKSEAEAAKKSAEEALAKAGEADKAAAKAAVDAATAKDESIKAAQAEVAKAKAELEATLDAKFEEEKGKLTAIVTELTEKVEKLTKMSTEMITSLDIQAFGTTESAKNDFDDIINLQYYQIDEDKKWNDATSYTFGEGKKGSFTINAGEIISVSEDKLLVSVSPTNAALPSEILSFIDSKGNSLEGQLALTSESFDEKLVGYMPYNTKSIANGLYSLGVKLNKDADMKVLNENATTLYAVAATREGRTVASTFDIMLNITPATANEVSYVLWNSKIKSTISPEERLSEFTKNTKVEDQPKAYNVADGEPFTINVGCYSGPIMASYIEVDYSNKELSTTDKVAIKTLDINGDEEVRKDNMFELTVKGAEAHGIAIPLKITTIDFNGDVKTTESFWVKVGGESAIEQTVGFIVSPEKFVETPKKYSFSGIQAITVPAAADMTKTSLSIKISDNKVYDQNDLTPKFFKDAKGKESAKTPAEAKFLGLKGNLDLQALEDGKVYEGVIKFYNKENTFLSQTTVTLQKVLPTAFPKGFSAKTNAIDANGVLTVYPIAENGAGKFDLSQAFNGLDSKKDNFIEHLVFSSENVELVGDGTEAHKANVVFKNGTDSYLIDKINKDIINNGKAYDVKVSYDYGEISSDKDHRTHSVDWATTFSIKFACMIVDASYAWTTEPVVYYNTKTTLVGEVTENKAKKAANVITVKDVYGDVMNPFVDEEPWTKFANKLDVSTTVTLKTVGEDGSIRNNEFFNASFVNNKDVWGLFLDPKSTNVVLTNDVKTEVVITINDKFGHKHEVSALSFTMKKNKLTE